jgi:predicted HNH restriction endonuclease
VDPHKRAEAAKRRRDLRDRAIAFLGGKCQICGYDRSPAAFDFHHVEVWRKDFTISEKMTSWEKIEPELKKTVLLCANCHREVHDGLHPGYVEYEESNLGGDWGELLGEDADGL